MAIDSVPWFVGGGALHSPEVARLLAYAATSGAAGVVAPGDLKITQLPVPAGSVRMATGGGVIPNLYPGASQQTYISRAPSVTDIAVTPTGSGSGRVDLVIARIDDPQYGGAAPADPTVGPYVRLAIIENVAAGSTDLPVGTAYPAIALARLNIPASTATITTALITDLRKVARPRRERRVDAVFPTAIINVTSTAYTTLGQTVPIAIPAWATQVKLRADFSGLCLLVGNVTGNLRPTLGTASGQTTFYDENWGGTSGAYLRTNGMAAMEMAIPVELRGTNQILYFQANRTAGAGYLRVDTYSTLFGDLEFLEVAE